jgi:hypothetical protein
MKYALKNRMHGTDQFPVGAYQAGKQLPGDRDTKMKQPDSKP